MASTGTQLTREEKRKKREIEDARKAGTLPPAVDNEGNMINPHVPEYMSKAPWYLNQDEGEGLKHQKVQKRAVNDNKATFHRTGASSRFLRKGLKKTQKRRKWVKGACANCGALTHKTKDCVERPRKLGAKFTNKDIRPDEYIPEQANLTFDAKRDRYAGFDPRHHQATIERYKQREKLRREQRRKDLDAKSRERAALRKKRKEEKEERRRKRQVRRVARAAALAERARRKERGEDPGEDISEVDDSDSDSDSDSDDDDSEDDDGGEEHKQQDSGDVMFGKEFRVNAGAKMTIRNLRIREDTAKYLRNLNPNSAYYDPKTRSMRADPLPHVPASEKVYAGDNFVRGSGEVADLAKTQLFAWDSYNRGKSGAHLMANPTQMQLEHRQFKERKEKLKTAKRDDILKKYGGEEHMNAKGEKMSRALLTGETEQYAEYSRDGRLVKGQERAKRKSRYQEDVLESNHTEIWGSWYCVDSHMWGYACCHQTQRRAYCTGAAGIEAERASKEVLQQSLKRRAAEMSAGAAADAAAEGKSSTGSMDGANGGGRSDLFGEQLKPNLDQEKLRKILAAEEERERKRKEGQNGKRKEKGSRKRKKPEYSSGRGEEETEVTAEQMEAYKLKKVRRDDPMARGAVGDDGLLPLQ